MNCVLKVPEQTCGWHIVVSGGTERNHRELGSIATLNMMCEAKFSSKEMITRIFFLTNDVTFIKDFCNLLGAACDLSIDTRVLKRCPLEECSSSDCPHKGWHRANENCKKGGKSVECRDCIN